MSKGEGSPCTPHADALQCAREIMEIIELANRTGESLYIDYGISSNEALMAQALIAASETSALSIVRRVVLLADMRQAGYAARKNGDIVNKEVADMLVRELAQDARALLKNAAPQASPSVAPAESGSAPAAGPAVAATASPYDVSGNPTKEYPGE